MRVTRTVWIRITKQTDDDYAFGLRVTRTVWIRITKQTDDDYPYNHMVLGELARLEAQLHDQQAQGRVSPRSTSMLRTITHSLQNWSAPRRVICLKNSACFH